MPRKPTISKLLRTTAAGISLIAAPAVLLAAPSPPSRKAPVASAAKTAIEFDRDVRPILSENCFKCHGFDEKSRQGGLRLDTPEGSFAALAGGRRAIAPGHPDTSELVKRIRLTRGPKMPPESSGKVLKPAQIEILTRWVQQGARYAPHWAFVPPKRPAFPPVQDARWVRNPIDRFVLARLEREKLKPSPEADRSTLIRRLSLDLRGLPPTLAEVNRFLGDRRSDAYERLVDEFLASPHYGERMALRWLDLARYADTHGYHIDSHRDMWLWRDWVISAYNKNIPFDQFTIEQLAGDLLPNATREQRIATGFNRNHPINFEGGAIPEEYHAAYIFDRIDTTATTWMALTLRCTQCHDHKYEPFTQREFYKLFAFFHNVPEKGLDGQRGNAAPFLKVPSSEQEKEQAELQRKIADLDTASKARASETAQERAEWEKSVLAGSGDRAAEGLVARFPLDETVVGTAVRSEGGKRVSARLVGTPGFAEGKVAGALRLDGNSSAQAELGDFERDQPFSYGAWVKPTGREAMAVISRMDDAAANRGWDLYLQDGKVYVHLISEWEGNAIRLNTRDAVIGTDWAHVFATYDGSSKASGVKIYVNGKPAATVTTHDRLSGSIRTQRLLQIGRRTPGAPFKGLIDDVRLYERSLDATEVLDIAGLDSVRPLIAVEPGKRTPEQTTAILRYFLDSRDPAYAKLSADLAAARARVTEIENAIPTVMVMEEMAKPRETHVLIRGQYDRRGDAVTAGFPAAIPAPATPGKQPNRLDLARWLVSPDHPLTARVAVNRYWEIYFGQGIVKTTENFGLQGDRPSHPELLDWLATEFIRTGWDVKAMQRLIVSSATYRQVSVSRPELKHRDPENQLLAHGPRMRLPAELIRDQALALSGLFAPKVGGPSVKPYHPAGLWEELAFGGNFTAQTYVQDHGDALYRRTMYTFWKRTCPPPSLTTFDAPDREFCVVRRGVTNTPLQALVLWNDPTYVEAARHFAQRLMTEVSASPEDRIRYAYRLALCRSARPVEVQVMLGVYRDQLARYRADRTQAEKLLAVGESPRNKALDVAEHAAWTSVASVLLNLDEVISKN